MLARGRRILQTVRVIGPRATAGLVLDRAAPGRSPATRVMPAALAEQLEAILRGWGLSPEHAAVTARHVLYADLHAIDSHGCAMLVHYRRALDAGRLEPRPVIEVVHEGASTALVDGGGGLGHVPAHRAMTLAVAKCRDGGVAAVAVRNSGHFGAAGAYASLAAEAGVLGLVTSSADLPAIVPTRGRVARLGTNPIAFSAPGGRGRPLLLDMATSTVSLGKLVAALYARRAIPPGWAVDRAGAPLTDAKRAYRERLLTPLGSTAEGASHKGYGLAVLAETLSSILSGTPAWHEEPYAHRPVGHFFLAIDPRHLRGDDGFGDALDVMRASLRESEPLAPDEPVLAPGDPEHAAAEERARLGIPIPGRVLADLRTLAAAADAPFLLGRA